MVTSLYHTLSVRAESLTHDEAVSILQIYLFSSLLIYPIGSIHPGGYPHVRRWHLCARHFYIPHAP